MGDTAPDGTLYTENERARFNAALSDLTAQIVLEPDREFSIFLLRTWHGIVSKDVQKMLPGVLRTSQPTVFGSFRACLPHMVEERLRHLVVRVKRTVESLDQHVAENGLDERGLDYLINESSYLHAELISIHPFMDGNGRMARLCQVWMLSRFGVVALPEFNDRDTYLAAINKFHTSDRKDYQSLGRLTKELIVAAALASRELN